ncbi:MAG: ABC-F family ATP-binding cassette domain-containing protein [Alphaproteobacteria bacterium]
MSLLTTNSLGVTLGAPLFSDLTFAIAERDRIGLVAANGRGKSTLLRCLAGVIEPTSGEVTRARSVRIGLVEQDLPAEWQRLAMRDVVLRALPAEAAETESWRVDIVLEDLAVPEALRERPLGRLSGGWQQVARLARAWVTEPDILLLDEPTNHLDLERIGLLQHWLSDIARSVPIMVASHDRAFLDAVTNRTLFLRETQSQLYALPYTPARAALAEADAADERRFDHAMKQAKQMRRQAAKLKNIGVNSGSDLLLTKTRQLRARAERLEDGARAGYKARSAGAIRLGNSGTHAKALATFDAARIETPDGRLLFETGKIWIHRGDRVVLLGANGSGKSQLVAALRRAIAGEAGAIKVAAALVPGCSDQELSQLDGDPTPFAAIAGRFDVGDQRARALLAGAGIGIDLQSAPIQALSGGQKARLAMLVLRLTQPNFYLLDEPTNHLDIEGQEALETELLAHGATSLLVSHDRTFVREVGTRFWLIEGRRLVEVEDPEDFFAVALGSQP